MGKIKRGFPGRVNLAAAAAIAAPLLLLPAVMSLYAEVPEPSGDTGADDEEKQEMSTQYRYSAPDSGVAPIDTRLYEVTETAAFAAG